MKKAKIGELRNGLSRYLDHVRAGGSVVVYDRDTPIAEIVPVHVPRPRQFGMEALDEFQRAASRIRQLIFGVERTTVH